MSMKICESYDLMEKWALDENEALGFSPYQITTGSEKKVWWRCVEKRHLYLRAVCNEKVGNSTCPMCNSISERPDLMEKWASKRNEALGILPHQITAGSNKKVWWQCSARGHLYQRTISKVATRNPQCPVCKEENQKYLSDYPEILQEFAYDLNNISPAELTAGSDTVVKWRCKKCGQVWGTAPYHRIKEKTRCPYCSKKTLLRGFNDLLTVNPVNMRYWDYESNEKYGILASNYALSAKRKVWWMCDKGHRTYDTISHVISRKTACLECLNEKRKASAEKALEKKGRKEAHAKQREAPVKQREKHANNREYEKVAEESKELEKQKQLIITIEPVAQFWDYEENQKRGFLLEAVTYKRVYCWKCSDGHRWKSALKYMLNNPECHECAIEKKSIAHKYSYLVENYNVDMNRGVPPEKCLAIVAKNYWWTCRNGHTFIAPLGQVVKHKATGCMYCDRKKSFYSL